MSAETFTHVYRSPIGVLYLRKLDDHDQYRVINHEPSEELCEVLKDHPDGPSFTGWLVTVKPGATLETLTPSARPRHG